MPEFLRTALGPDLPLAPLQVALRLLAALVLGGVVAWVYRHTRAEIDQTASFPPTLVLLAILIAMVTQVIGDNVARAFSLVGALSIVRFRTVVRDTQDTAFVIFAVVVGMAVGANDPWVALIGISVVTLAAYLMKGKPATPAGPLPPVLLHLRIGLGHDLDGVVAAVLDEHLSERRLLTITTAKQGVALDMAYEARIRPTSSPGEVVKALNRIEGVQSVELTMRDAAADPG